MFSINQGKNLLSYLASLGALILLCSLAGGSTTLAQADPPYIGEVRIFDTDFNMPNAAGLACEGLKPVVAIYSTFLQRAYDQLIHDVALQNLPVVFALDRAGLVGGDGATHQGSYDYSFLRCIPNLTVMAPADEDECRQMLYTATTLAGPAAVRYPRGQGPGVTPVAEMTALRRGKFQGRWNLSRSGGEVDPNPALP